jgi:NADPH:quinone reductase-like Zn-dependent oxidoreductase
MKAIVYSGYGPPDVLKIEEIAKPAPRDDEVLIKVRAAAINPLDRHIMRGKPFFLRMGFGLRKPKVRPGRDVAGQVEAVGRKVTRFKAGDEVFGACSGALAEYACTRERALVTKPTTVSFEQAASVPVAGLTALQGLRNKGKIQSGQKILINGAGGGVGTFAVQIAKSFGADVTGVCSTSKVDLVRSIGADRVIDYTHEDFTEGRQRYDLIFDLAATHSMLQYRRVLNPNGTCVLAGGPTTKVSAILASAFEVLVLSRFVSQTFVMFVAKVRTEDLTLLGELMKTGKLTPVIDRRYKLNEVPGAIRYLEEGHARGKIVITVEHDGKMK